MDDKVKIFKVGISSKLNLPFADEGVRAGFPSPAQDYVGTIDLNKDLIEHEESTFYARVEGDSMIGAGLLPGDILVIDKSLEYRKGDIALCVVNGEFTVKYVEKHDGYITLVPDNDEYQTIRVGEGDYFEVWGIVTYVIHKMRHK